MRRSIGATRCPTARRVNPIVRAVVSAAKNDKTAASRRDLRVDRRYGVRRFATALLVPDATRPGALRHRARAWILRNRSPSFGAVRWNDISECEPSIPPSLTSVKRRQPKTGPMRIRIPSKIESYSDAMHECGRLYFNTILPRVSLADDCEASVVRTHARTSVETKSIRDVSRAVRRRTALAPASPHPNRERAAPLLAREVPTKQGGN
jgi:hypothetical protein